MEELSCLLAAARGETCLEPVVLAQKIETLSTQISWIGRDRLADVYVAARHAASCPEASGPALRCLSSLIHVDERFLTDELFERSLAPILSASPASDSPIDRWAQGAMFLCACLEKASSLGGNQLLRCSPTLLASMLRCVNGAVRAVLCASMDDEIEGRIRPLCDMLKVVHDNLPDPRKTAQGGTICDQIIPALQESCCVTLDACEAEENRPRRRFIAMNATWKLLVRLCCIMPLSTQTYTDAANKMCEPSPDTLTQDIRTRVLRCTHASLERAFKNEETGIPSAAEAVKVTQFFLDKLKLICAAFSQWLIVDCVRTLRSGHGQLITSKSSSPFFELTVSLSLAFACLSVAPYAVPSFASSPFSTLLALGRS